MLRNKQKAIKPHFIFILQDNLLNIYFVTDVLVHSHPWTQNTYSKNHILVFPFEVIEKLQNDKSYRRQL